MGSEQNLNHPSIETGKDALMKDIKVVVGDADNLLQEVANASVEEFSAARANIESCIGDAKSKLHEARVAVSGKACCVANAAQQYVNGNPWKTIGAMAALGVVIGLLIRRR